MHSSFNRKLLLSLSALVGLAAGCSTAASPSMPPAAISPTASGLGSSGPGTPGSATPAAVALAASPTAPIAADTSTPAATQPLPGMPSPGLPLPGTGLTPPSIPLQPSPQATEKPLTPAVTPGGPPFPDCRTTPLPVTPADMEGPYYLGDTPERSSLAEPGTQGTPLVISGFVLHADCSPVANARLDFWQADASGQYDVSGYTLRGHLFTAADGSYRLETILPAVYTGRPRHIHARVDAPGISLTTQLYFPGDSPIPAQTVAMTEANGSATAYFNFILP